MASKRAYAEEDEGLEAKQKMPRLIGSEAEDALEERGCVIEAFVLAPLKLTIQISMLDLTGGDLTVRCGPWAWQCHKDVLSSRCSFFKACCGGGFTESTTREIILHDDEPRAIQAMLRYLYTLDLTQIYRPNDPLFSDVERDLDVLVVADKYGLDKLRDYMSSNLVLFYEADKRPPGDPKGWSVKNQEGFGRVLRKLAGLEMEMKDIRGAVARFIVRREGTVMKWSSVKSAIDDGLWLRDEVALAAVAAKRELEQRVQYLERDVDELQEKLECVEAEREELYGEVETLQGLLRGGESAYLGWDDREEWDFIYEDDHNHLFTDNRFREGYDTPVEPVQPLFVEDILSGVSYVLGEEGPEPLVPDSPEHQG